MGCGASSKKKYEDKAGSGGADDYIIKYLSKVPLFQRLPDDELPALARAAEPMKFKSGQTIIKEGDFGNEFYIIEKGTAEVHQKDHSGQVFMLNAGDFFGEKALLRDVPRNATIKASGFLEALRISRKVFAEMGLMEKLAFKNRGAFGGGGDGDKVVTKSPSEKTDEEFQLMCDAVMANKNISSVIHLDDELVRQIVELMWKEDVAEGEHIISQGDNNADYFYIVQSGKFQVMLMADMEDEEENEEEAGEDRGSKRKTRTGSCRTSLSMEASIEILCTLGPGMSFGELALLYQAPRAASIVAMEDSIVWVIDRMQFKMALKNGSDQLIQEYVTYLHKVPILDDLTADEKEALARALHEMCFGEDEYVFKQGDDGNNFYILLEGEAAAYVDDHEVQRYKVTAVDKPFFGELALKNHVKRKASIKILSHSATTLAIDRVTFDMLLGKVTQKSLKQFGKIVYSDLKPLGLLGCGGFGGVSMVKHKVTQDTYALKQMSKGYIVQIGLQKSVISEKNVQILCDSPFIINLYETFNGRYYIFLLLELALGGELYQTYNKKHLWGKEAHAKFYIAGATYAFEHLHAKKIVFRDLKPENLLLSHEGQVKLTDLGLAKVVVGKTYTTCGTPDYIAPELLDSRGHSLLVDWWTLGILTFELMSGHPPFESVSPMQTFHKVKAGIDKVRWPHKLSRDHEAFVKGLLQKDPARRLPAKKGHTENLKKHPWYAGFDWETMKQCKLTPPYKPAVVNIYDKSNFTARKEDIPPQLEYKDPRTGWDAGFATGSMG